MPAAELQTASEIATASDGRPFRTGGTPPPPCPGGSWPGQRPEEIAKARCLVIDLTRENLDTHDKRRAAVGNIMESGFVGNAISSNSAHEIVSAAWEEIQGNPMPLDTRRWIANQREKIAQFNQAHRDALALAASTESLRQLHATRNSLTAGLVARRNALAAADSVIANHLAGIEQWLDDQSGPEGVIRFGSRLAGAREVAAILRKTVIPASEKRLAKVDSEIANHALTPKAAS